VSSDDLHQPTPLIRNRLVHALSQLLLDLLELRPHTVAPTPTVDKKLSSTRLTANEGKPQDMLDPTFLRICVLGTYVVLRSIGPKMQGARKIDHT
jgi:hypothetical protein